MSIHPTAIVHAGARLGEGVEIGPYSIVGEHAEIGHGTTVGPYTVITGHTRIGCGNRIFGYCSLGEAPQDKKYAGEETRLEIGDRNTIREFCTFNRGTVQDVGVTRLGDDNWIMAYVHLAHDCQIGNHTIFANNTQLAGHVVVGDYAVLGGFTGVHQFCRIGAHVMTGVSSVILQDIPPFVMAHGNPAKPHGINGKGLSRRGFAPDVVQEIKRSYKVLYRQGNALAEARALLAERAAACPELQVLVDFLGDITRGIIR